MAKLTLSLGSNVGDRDLFLREARDLLRGRLGRLVYASEVIETEPWGKPDQSSFLNQVVMVVHSPEPAETSVGTYLHSILDITQAIEAELGRERKEIWGPRTVDIDLIFADDLTFEDERISLPHPWWREREFVTRLLPPQPAVYSMRTPVFSITDNSGSSPAE